MGESLNYNDHCVKKTSQEERFFRFHIEYDFNEQLLDLKMKYA